MLRAIDCFRSLIVLALLTLGFALYVSFNLAPPTDADELWPYLVWVGYGAVEPWWLNTFVWYINLSLTVTGLLTAFFFIRNAHYLLLTALFFFPIQTAIGGIWLSSPLEDTFWAIHSICFTLVLGMALFDETIRTRLKMRSNNIETSQPGI